MYCKYCGSAIDKKTVLCPGCGAKIDLTDGGQSFYEDDELAEWGAAAKPAAKPEPKTAVSAAAYDDVPRTEDRRPVEYTEDDFGAYPKRRSDVSSTAEIPDAPRRRRPSAEPEIEPTIEKNPVPRTRDVSEAVAMRRRRRAKEKQSLKKRLLMNPNMLITVCIAGAVFIALIIVSMVALVSKTDEESGAESGAEPTETVAIWQGTEESAAEQGTDNAGDTGEETAAEETVIYMTLLPEGTYEEVQSRLYDENGAELPNQHTMYRVNGILYTSFDHMMLYLGYKNGTADLNNVAYEKDGTRVEVVKGGTTLYLRDENDNWSNMELEGAVYNFSYENETTYVPAYDLLRALNIRFSDDGTGNLTIRTDELE